MKENAGLGDTGRMGHSHVERLPHKRRIATVEVMTVVRDVSKARRCIDSVHDRMRHWQCTVLGPRIGPPRATSAVCSPLVDLCSDLEYAQGALLSGHIALLSEVFFKARLIESTKPIYVPLGKGYLTSPRTGIYSAS